MPEGPQERPFIILAIVPYAQVWDHDGKLLASELSRKRFGFAKKQDFFFSFVVFQSVLRIDEV
jgi:hypothetical protein